MKIAQQRFFFLAVFLFTCSTIICLPLPTFAASYHVAPSPAGSDNNSGNLNHPFATLQKAANTVNAGDNVLVSNGHYKGFTLSTNGTPTNRIEFSATGTQVIIDQSNPDGYGIFLSNVSYVTIQGFKVQGMENMGIVLRHASPYNPVHGLIIRNNTVIDCTSVGMYFSEVMDSLIENNEVAHCGLEGTHCLYMANAGTGSTIIRGNSLHHCPKAGIHFNGDESVGGDGIISGLIVEQNRIYNNGLNALNMDGVQDSIIRNNLIYNNNGNGIRAFRIDASEGPKNLIIVNNTIHVPQREGGWAVRITSELGGNTVFNNILFNEGWGGSIAIDHDSYGFSSAHNVVVDRFTPDRDDTLLNLKEWQALGYDSGSFLASPEALFMDYRAGDYRLAAHSPAIDAGLSSFAGAPAPVNDLISSARPLGRRIDIGAYEYLSPSPISRTARLPFIALLLD